MISMSFKDQSAPLPKLSDYGLFTGKLSDQTAGTGGIALCTQHTLIL